MKTLSERKLSWSEETMEIINQLTPDINGKSLNPDLFLLRHRLEEIERCAACKHPTVVAYESQHRPKAGAEREWISVTDRLPEMGAKVSVKWLDHEGDTKYGEDWLGSMGNWCMHDTTPITHWQPVAHREGGENPLLVPFGPLRESERDWPEDFPHENGNYVCHCVTCKQSFLGHKRRVECKACAVAKPVAPDSGKVRVMSGNPEEALSMLEAIHADVQANFHDQWDWFNAAFCIEVLRAALASQIAPEDARTRHFLAPPRLRIHD